MESESNNDLVRELRRIQTSEDLNNWKQQHQITLDLINEFMADVRRLLDSAQLDAAGRLSEWCVLLADGLTDPVDRNVQANVLVTKGIALARVNDDVGAVTYFDRALQLYEQAGEE